MLSTPTAKDYPKPTRPEVIVLTRSDLLAWIDLETTGLDPNKCAILEVAMLLTDQDLKPVHEPLSLVVWQSPSVLGEMRPKARWMHEATGLLEEVVASELALQEAQIEMTSLLTEHAVYRTALLAGSSVSFDRRFLCTHMPSFEACLHYRQIDVSSVKELGRRWLGVEYDKPVDRQHRALFDLQQSIEELRYLRSKLFGGTAP